MLEQPKKPIILESQQSSANQEDVLSHTNGFADIAKIVQAISDVTSDLKLPLIVRAEKYYELVAELKRQEEKWKKLSPEIRKIISIYNKYRKNEELTKDDFVVLNSADSNIEEPGEELEHMMTEIVNDESIKNDIAKAFNCTEEEVSMTAEHAMNGGIKCFFGNLYLDGFVSAKNLNIPNQVVGDLNLEDIETAEGLKLPKWIGGSLFLFALTSAEGLELPEYVGGAVYFENMNPDDVAKLKIKYSNLEITLVS